MYIKIQVPKMIEQTKMTIENDDFNIPVVIDKEVRQMAVQTTLNIINVTSISSYTGAESSLIIEKLD